MISQNGFFNLNFDITNISPEKYSTSILRKIYKNTAILDTLALAKEMGEIQNISELIGLYNSIGTTEIKVEKSCLIQDFNNRTRSFIEAAISGFKLALKMGVIHSYCIHQPFCRFSMDTQEIITTYFISVSYSDGKIELWAFEEIPNDDLLLERGIDNLNDSLDIAIFSVRNSIFWNNNIYSYPKTLSNDEKCRVQFVMNYKLCCIIEYNFGIKINRNIRRISIGSESTLIDSINTKSKKTKSIHFDLNSPYLLIGFHKNGLTYFDYREKVLSNIIYYEIIYTTYRRFIKLSKKKRNEFQNAIFCIMASFLSKSMQKDKIVLNANVELLIKKQGNYEKENLLVLLSSMAGAFFSKYNS